MRNRFNVSENQFVVQVAAKQVFERNQIFCVETLELQVEGRQQEENPYNVLDANVEPDGRLDREKEAQLRCRWKRIFLSHVDVTVAISRLKAPSSCRYCVTRGEISVRMLHFGWYNPLIIWRHESFVLFSIFDAASSGKPRLASSSRLERRKARIVRAHRQANVFREQLKRFSLEFVGWVKKHQQRGTQSS